MFPMHTSLLANLYHFTSVREFTLQDYRFAAFSDVRRIIGALRSLSTLHLLRTTWAVCPSEPTALLRTTSWKVSTIHMNECTSDWVAIWFWISPSTKAPKTSYYGARDQDSHPGLSLSEVRVIYRVLRSFPLHLNAGRRTSVQGVEYTCEFDSQVNKCKLLHTRVSYMLRELPGLLRIGMENQLAFAVLSIDGSLDRLLTTSTKHFEAPATRGSTVSIRLVYQDHVGEYDWGSVDTLLNELGNLQLVHLEFPSIRSLPIPQYLSSTDLAKSQTLEIARRMPLVRRRCKLEISIKNQFVVWDESDLGQSGDQDLGSLVLGSEADIYDELVHGLSGLTSQAARIILQLRLDYAPLNGYLYHIGKIDSPDCPACPRTIESAYHVLMECPAHVGHRARLYSVLQELGKGFGMNTILYDPLVVSALFEFIRSTGRLEATVGDDPV